MKPQMQADLGAEQAASVPPVGRSFILGLPDREGVFRVYLNGALWRIPAGSYAAGDRVRVMQLLQDGLVVEAIAAA